MTTEGPRWQPGSVEDDDTCPVCCDGEPRFWARSYNNARAACRYLNTYESKIHELEHPYDSVLGKLRLGEKVQE